MADLTAEWHEIEGPAREDLSFFISGGGADRWDVFQIQDSSEAGLDIGGCSLSAEIRDDSDNHVATLTAAITDAATGVCRVSSSAALNAGLTLPDDAPVRGSKIKLGRYSYFITDSAGRWCIKAGDAYGIRK
jgi:hypothetical protein